MNVIEVKDLIKKFDTKKVIDNISFEVAEGNIFGFLGPSGAGKTTLIKILLGEYSATKGIVKVFGKKPENYSDEITNSISAVMDNFGLYERLTVYENLEVFSNIYKADKNEISSILEKVEISDSKNQIVSKLSKGMKQRLMIARALLNHPKLLFLDEPTSGLDPATSLKIHNVLFELKNDGTTIFLTTHNMEEATKMCDNVALLHLGKIVEFGTPKDICMRNNENNTIKIITKNNKEIILKNNKENASKIAKMFEQEDVLSIHSSEPTLENVFIKLTGKELV